MRFINKAASLAAALVTSAAVAGAQVQVAGSTMGCFGVGCTNFSSSANYTIGTSGEVINFAGTSFSGETNPVTNGFTVGNFGTLTLTPAPSGSTPNQTFSTPFTLMFTLTAPAGSSSPTSTFVVAGFVGNTNGQGTRDISYGPASVGTFTSPGGGTGTITIDGGQIGVVATTISGRVTATAGTTTTPEPATYAMMGMGLAGMLVAARRRRSA